LFRLEGVTPHDYNKSRNLVPDEIPVTINGERRPVHAGSTLLDVIHSLQLEPERVAVELDRTIVRRERWADTRLDPMAEIEIVQFVGGG
jgi:thiamine biosynthesis protein ThiS